MKKIIALLLTVVLTASVAVGGTVAYFTDTEEVTNTMTVGKVDVSLVEKQRNEDGTALEVYEDKKELSPLVGSAQGEKDKFGMPVAENFVDKIVYATNDTAKPAYIRFLIALPVELVSQDTTDTPLHWSWGNRVDINGNSASDGGDAINAAWKAAYTYADIEGQVTIDNKEYYVMHFTMNEALAGNGTSLAVMAGLYLDNRVDYDDEANSGAGAYTFDGTAINYDLSQGVKVPILLQAVQTDGFADVNEAMTTAFGALNATNIEKWFAE